jgi:putative toxin-antitoxin system antitoxin component (TIGR02293 family)
VLHVLRTIQSPHDLTRLIRKGTLTRRLSEELLLTPAESDRAVRMARVYANAVEMIGDEEKAIEWLSTPNRALGGEMPLDQLDTDTGARVVEDLLGRIAHGVYS